MLPISLKLVEMTWGVLRACETELCFATSGASVPYPSRRHTLAADARSSARGWECKVQEFGWDLYLTGTEKSWLY